MEDEMKELNDKLSKCHQINKQLEDEILSIKSVYNAAIEERNELTRLVERRNVEIERLQIITTDLTSQLQVAIDAKCEAVSLNNEFQNRELSLQQSEKRMEQERQLLNSQISALTDEVNRLTSELKTVMINNDSKLLNLETKLKETTEELNLANETINKLNEANRKLNIKNEFLSQRVLEQTELGNKLTTNYKKELDLKTKTTDLYKTMHSDTEIKAGKLMDGIVELQKLLQIGTEKYGELETKYKQEQLEHDTQIEKKNEIIASLKTELEHANDLLTSISNQDMDVALSELTPSAALASKVLKSGISLTQMYAQYLNVSDELNQAKEEIKSLKITINEVIQELEEKAPALSKTKLDLQEALETNIALTHQLDSLNIEISQVRNDLLESTKINSHYKSENLRLEEEIQNLQNQLCFLLKDIEKNRTLAVANGDHNISYKSIKNSNSFENTSLPLISKSLLKFSDIQELVSNNQKLLRVIKELTEKQEQLELIKTQFESGDYEHKIEVLKKRIIELTETQDRQSKMVNEIIKQRDLYKKMYNDHQNKSKENMELSTLSRTEILEKSGDEVGIINNTQENTFIKTEQQLTDLKEELKNIKEQKINSEKILHEKIAKMNKEIDKLTSVNNKNSSTAEYYNEQLKVLQSNIATYKKQITCLEVKNKEYNTTISKQETLLQHFRSIALTTQQKISSADISLDKYKLQSKLLRDRETMLKIENNHLMEKQHDQETILKYMDNIKCKVEYVETEVRAKVEERLEDAKRECTAIRRQLEEEQNKFKEKEFSLKSEIKAANMRMLEEKNVADGLRNEISELQKKNENNQRICDELFQQIPSNENGASLHLKQKIKELDNIILEKNNEIMALEEQLRLSKNHVKQYCDISERAENTLRIINDEYKNYKSKTDAKLDEYSKNFKNLEDRCAELEAELSLQSQDNNTPSVLQNELSKTLNDLEEALRKLKERENELNTANVKLTKLTEKLKDYEEKFEQVEIEQSSNMVTLASVKQEVIQLQIQLKDMTTLKNDMVHKLGLEKAKWEEREAELNAQFDQLSSRFDNLNSQNSLLLDQIQAFSLQLSVSHASRSFTDSFNDSTNVGSSTANTSHNEEVELCSEQFLEIVKFLRKEKDFAVSKCDTLQTEILRLKSQLEESEKQLVEIKSVFNKQSPESNSFECLKQSDIIKKIETLDALSDNNRQLRIERDNFQARIENLTIHVKNIEQEVSPLKEKNSQMLSKIDSLETENNLLKGDIKRWKTRVNFLIARTNKSNSDDLKRVENERESLANMLNIEKGNVKKVCSELDSIKIEKSKLEDQYSVLSRQYTSLIEDHKKINEELNKIKIDSMRVTEESSKLKSEIGAVSKTNDKLTLELSAKEAILTDIRSKELQIRKIAKKYKAQFEELSKIVDEEKNKPPEQPEDTQLIDLQNQLDTEKANVEKLKSELESSVDKEDKAKRLLKIAKSKIVHLTETKNSLIQELNESRIKIETIDQTNRDEKDERLALIKSQFEGKLSKLEKEKCEIQVEKSKEIEALLQKISLLQRQLANQTNVSKPINADKTTSDPPTANIKPMAGKFNTSYLFISCNW